MVGDLVVVLDETDMVSDDVEFIVVCVKVADHANVCPYTVSMY